MFDFREWMTSWKGVVAGVTVVLAILILSGGACEKTKAPYQFQSDDSGINISLPQ